MITLTSLSLGEILKKAGLNTLMGMGVVFIVLILISLLIYCLRYIPILTDFLNRMVGDRFRAWREAGKQRRAEKQAARRNDAAAADSTASQEDGAAFEAEAPAAQEADSLYPVGSDQPDLALIAVITAAIAAATDTPADGIVIRSIRRSTNNNWKRA